MGNAAIITGLVVINSLGWLAASASAQGDSRGYVAAVAGALTVKADQAGGTRPMAGGVVGLRLRPWADLEADIGLTPGAVTRTFSGPLIAFGPPSSSFDDFESRAVIARITERRESQALLSVGVRLHASSAGARVRPYAFAGVTGHWVRDTRRVEVLRLPPGVTQADIDRALPAETPSTRNVGGLTVGGGVEFAFPGGLSLAPDVRFDYGSFGDEINNTLRTSLRVGWRF